ncbi:MAG: hypothetical protein RL213_1902 [Bacteroidota bacterium]
MKHFTSNSLMKGSILFLSAFLSLSSTVEAQLSGAAQPKFVNQLTVPPYLVLTGGTPSPVNITASQFSQDLGVKDPATGAALSTTVWGYNGTFPGPTIVTRSNVPVRINWLNRLVTPEGRNLPHLLPVDPTIHWALEGLRGGISRYGVPLVTHLHGGKTEAASDGYPDAWYTPFARKRGPDFTKGDNVVPYYYANEQPAATNWYHDHALGLTRLNVYAGLAGGYLIRDAVEEQQMLNNQLPSGEYELPLIICDRMFDNDGELFYPSSDPMTGMTNTILPEFFGDFILVNGKAWPVMDVEPRPYRFRIVNGCDSRFLNLYTRQPVTFRKIGADMGFLPAPVTSSELLIAPGERLDVIIDFSANALSNNNRTIIIRNNARCPFPNGAPVDPDADGLVMSFRVTKPLNTAVPTATVPTNLRPAIVPNVQNGPTRQLLLYEGTDMMGRLMPMLGTAAGGAMMWSDPVTETPALNSTEMWEVYNTTPDAHPVHLHSTAFQIINRQRFTATQDPTTGAISNIALSGPARGPQPGEDGWKDTAPAYPGEVLRVLSKFELPGKYVWHCHILSHEDNEMMRPLVIGSGFAGMRSGGSNPEQLNLFQNVPNPFSDYTVIDYRLTVSGEVNLKVYDMTGKLVETLVDEVAEAGDYSTMVKSDAWESGMYLYVLTSNGETVSRRMVRQ